MKKVSYGFFALFLLIFTSSCVADKIIPLQEEAVTLSQTVDTIITFDPVTFEETMHIVINDTPTSTPLTETIYQVDTIITFDPETYAENITIAKTPKVTYEDMIGHKINQIWYYNSNTKSLNSYLVEIAPLVKRQTIYENGLPFFVTKPYYTPLYYLRF